MIEPGDMVEHVMTPGKVGKALIREMHGGVDMEAWAVWLVAWTEDYDHQNIALSVIAYWHTEETLRVVKK